MPRASQGITTQPLHGVVVLACVTDGSSIRTVLCGVIGQVLCTNEPPHCHLGPANRANGGREVRKLTHQPFQVKSTQLHLARELGRRGRKVGPKQSTTWGDE